MKTCTVRRPKYGRGGKRNRKLRREGRKASVWKFATIAERAFVEWCWQGGP